MLSFGAMCPFGPTDAMVYVVVVIRGDLGNWIDADRLRIVCSVGHEHGDEHVNEHVDEQRARALCL